MLLQARAFAQQPRGDRDGGAMTIREPGQAANGSAAPEAKGDGADAEQMETDEDFARQLQAKMDAEEARRGCASAPLPLESWWSAVRKVLRVHSPC